MNNKPSPRTTFDWAIYANATFAGLAVLFPIPIIDWLLETFFRRRILSSIVNRRGHQLNPKVIRLLNNKLFDFKGCLSGCLTLPFVFTFWLIKKISRKILYFLTIKEATDALSYYWHQAFLLDYMLLRGHLKDEQTALLAREAMTQVLESITISPLIQLATQLMSSPRYIFATIRQARLRSPSTGQEESQPQDSIIKQNWNQFADYFESLAARYEQVYEELRQRPSPHPLNPPRTTGGEGEARNKKS